MAQMLGPQPPDPPPGGERGETPAPPPGQIERDVTSLRRAQGNPNTKGLMFGGSASMRGGARILLIYELAMEPEKKERAGDGFGSGQPIN